MNTREKWIDIAKGLGLIFVLIGHTKLYICASVVYIFHMPLFFFLSGYVFSGEKHDAKDFIKKKLVSLMLPYYVLGLLVLLANTLLNMYYVDFRMKYLMRITDEKYKIITYITGERFGTLWYIATLFWLNILLLILIKIFKSNYKIIAVAVITMAVIAFVYYGLGGGALYMNIDACFAMMPFYYAGYMANKCGIFHKEYFVKHSKKWLIGSILVGAIAGAVNFVYMGGHVDIYFNNYGLIPVMFIGSFAGIVAIICISFKLKSRFLEYIGCNSMLIYALHQATIFTLGEVVMYEYNKMWEHNMFLKITESIVCIILSLVIFGLLTVVIKKHKFAVIFGLKQG